MKGLGVRSFLKYNLIYPLKAVGKRKIFCIGRNKTGTTSLATEFMQLGYAVGHQRSAEYLIDAYITKDFRPITDYCKSAQVFQDIPFSWPETYKHLDKAFPDSLFILSERSNAEEWYQSITKFHSKLFGKGAIPSAQQLKEATYVYEGFMWKANRAIYNTPEDNPYKKEILIKHYNDYNSNVKKYFKNRKNLLVIDLKDSDAYERFCRFIDIVQMKDNFPWENKTEQHQVRK